MRGSWFHIAFVLVFHSLFFLPFTFLSSAKLSLLLLMTVECGNNNDSNYVLCGGVSKSFRSHDCHLPLRIMHAWYITRTKSMALAILITNVYKGRMISLQSIGSLNFI